MSIKTEELAHIDKSLHKASLKYCRLHQHLSCCHQALNRQAHLQDGLYILCKEYNVNAPWIDKLSILLCNALPCILYICARC